MEQSRYNIKDRFQTAKIRTRMSKVEGLVPPNVVGHNNWYDKTVRDLEMFKRQRYNARSFVAKGRLEGHMPVNRDMIITATNKTVHNYNNKVNVIIYELEKIYNHLNPKTLLRLKSKIELAQSNIINDQKTNKQAIRVRSTRPKSEKLNDDPDNVLLEEAQLLKSVSKIFKQLHYQSMELLKQLDFCRKQGQNVIKERKNAVGLSARAYPRDLRIERSKSADNVNLRNAQKVSPIEDLAIMTIDIDTCSPTEPITPAVKKFADNARNLIQETLKFVAKTESIISEKLTLCQTVHIRVNQLLSRKVAETENLLNEIKLAKAHQKHAINSVLRFKDHTVNSKGIALGVERLHDLETFEKLDRPLIKNYQRHYGNKTNELKLLRNNDHDLFAQHLACDRKLTSMNRNFKRMSVNENNKHRASSIDAAALRLRKREVMCM